jgi:hypothetical protein
LIVLDRKMLDRLPAPGYPERIVLIAPREPEHLMRAWCAGILSVVSQQDPVSTAMLAIMAARVRAMKCS